ncbi:hypothetical protein GYMLUDRAFT_262349 [Collybiopsis luxurians FD-317 M1]|uniref:G-protein coupled receptors family 1 profile domain-containing protein n=1 Tax=Collybiopsis luxurians FD-317 M1 TaxID=944289 RepID=A0A0D0B5Y9_9AGAR|nr:hypothetical protein GYMLUDRAFT_262349 [Collybiopsis luxurians FD-317 M1]
MSSSSQESTCPDGPLCFPYGLSYDEFVHILTTETIAPVVIGLTFYGIFIVLFSISIYIFHRRFLPGKFYVVTTILFFTLATTSVALELAQIFISPLYPVLFDFHFNVINQLQTASHSIFIVSGLLSDAILIYRCYRLWNSKKRVVVVPALGLVGSLVVWIVFTAVESVDFIYIIYILTTLGQNILLTGLIVGRVWWLNRRTNSIFIGQVDRAPSNLLWPVLISGVIVPLVLSICLLTDIFPIISNDGSLEFLMSPCFLTQIVGISSTLMIVFIGLGTEGSFSQVIVTNKELQNQSFGLAPTSARSNTSLERTHSPLLEHSFNQPLTDAELSRESISRTTFRSSVDENETVHPYLVGYDQGDTMV